MKKILPSNIIWGVLLLLGLTGMSSPERVSKAPLLVEPSSPKPTLSEESERHPTVTRWGTHRGASRILDHIEITEVLRRKLPDEFVAQGPSLARHIGRLCHQFKFDPAFILAVIDVESGFRVDAVSPVGAVGLMQLMPPTAQYISQLKGLKYEKTQDLYDPFRNITYGVNYLNYLREKYAGHVFRALAAYNAGPAKIDQLLLERRFKPILTQIYNDRIRERIDDMILLARGPGSPTPLLSFGNEKLTGQPVQEASTE